MLSVYLMNSPERITLQETSMTTEIGNEFGQIRNQ